MLLLTDTELVEKMIFSGGHPRTVIELEMNGRLVIALREHKASADTWARRLTWLTVAILVLTVVLVLHDLEWLI